MSKFTKFLRSAFGGAPAKTPKAKPPRKWRGGAAAREYMLDKSINNAETTFRRGVSRVPSALSAIRAHCRHLVHTNAYARQAVRVRTAHFVGGGIRINVSCEDKAYAQAFERWTSSTACDYERRKNFYGLQDLLVKAENEAGEGLAIIRDEIDEFGDVWPTIQCIDPDMIAEDVREPHTPGALVRSGVEYDESGRVLGVHIKKTTADDFQAGAGYASGSGSYFVPEEDVLHFFEPLYASQLRGIPRAAQVLSIAEIHSAFFRATLTKAEAEACFGLAIKRVPQDGGMGSEYDPAGGTDEGPLPLDYLEPGMIYYLAEGEEIQTINPSSSASFEPFVRISLEAICVGFGITYPQGSGDLSRVNFSSYKVGMNEFSRAIESLRSIHFFPLLRKIERRFRDCYLLNMEPPMRDATPGISSIGYDADQSYERRVAAVENATVTIIPPARERIDPQKETLVDMLLLKSGALSWGQFVLSHGKNPEEQMDALVSEREALARAGLNLQFDKMDTAISALADVVAAEDMAAAAADSEGQDGSDGA